MTNPSIAFGEREGSATRDAHGCGRVELLGGNGEVVQSWEIRPGDWTLGAASQNNIVLPDDPTIEDFHAIVTVGKKYTLVKAHGPIRVGGRLIKECLVDHSTMMECGSHRLVIHPCGRPAISVVTQDQITDVASKLAKASPPPRTREDDHTAITELRGELVHLRSALETIQSRFESFPAIENWDQRIEQLATQALGTIEVELGDKIREPLRDELLVLCQEQQPQWAADLKNRLLSLESQIRQLEEQWAQALVQTQEGLSGVSLRLVDLVQDQQSLRELIGRNVDLFADASRNSARARDSHNSIPYSADSDVEYLPGPVAGHPLVQDSESMTGRSFDDDADQIVQEEPSLDSDEVFEFQVDDESISLRLNRMLGERVERRAAQEVSDQRSLQPQSDPLELKLGADLNEPSAFDRAEDSPVNVVAPMDYDASGGILISDIYSEAESQSKFASPNSLESRLSAQEESIRGASRATHSAPEHRSEGHAGTHSEEESIEEYMQRLLQRVRTGPGAADSSTITKKEPTRGPSGRTSDPAQCTGGMNAAGADEAEQKKRSHSSTSKPIAKPIEEVKSDLAALRELANSNARRAINRSVIKRTSSKGLAKIALTVVALICGITLFFTPGISDNVKFGGVGVAMIIALLWGFEALRELSAMLFQRMQRRENQSSEMEPKRGAKSQKRKGSGHA